MPDPIYFSLRVLEVFASLLTGFSLLAIAVHEVGSNGWRKPK